MSLQPTALDSVFVLCLLLPFDSQFCLEEEDVWRCVLAWAKHKAGVTQATGHWTEEERSRVCQQLAGVMGHVRLLLIGTHGDEFCI